MLVAEKQKMLINGISDSSIDLLYLSTSVKASAAPLYQAFQPLKLSVNLVSTVSHLLTTPLLSDIFNPLKLREKSKLEYPLAEIFFQLLLTTSSKSSTFRQIFQPKRRCAHLIRLIMKTIDCDLKSTEVEALALSSGFLKLYFFS